MILKPVDTVIKIALGPAYDDTDFKSREAGIAYNAPGITVYLYKESTNDITVMPIALSNIDDDTHNYWAPLDANSGVYELRITATQNDTKGALWAVAWADGVLTFESPRYQVVPANVYDSLVAGSDKLQVDMVQIEGNDATGVLGEQWTTEEG